MKKALFVLLGVFIAASSLSAVDIFVGPKIIISDASYRGADWEARKDSENWQDRLSLSFAGGGFARLQFTPMLGMQVEALFVHQAIRMTDTDYSDYWHQWVMNSIEIPVYGRFQYDLEKFGIYALAGLDFNIFFDKYKWSDSEDNETEYSIKDSDGSLFLIGIGLGAGIIIPTDAGSLDIGLRYRTDLTTQYEDYNTYFESINIDISYGFKI